MTSKHDIQGWFDEGVAQQAEFMIVACDTFDHEDFPVYIKTVEQFGGRFEELQNPNQMSRVMEVYDLKKDRDEQMNSRRAWNLPGSRTALRRSE